MGYRVKSAFLPSQRKKREAEEIQLEVTPIMNLVVVLIPLLLQAVVLVKLGVIDYTPPVLESAEEIEDNGEGEGGGGGEAPVLLELNLAVNDSGFEVSIFNATEGEGYWKLPRRPDNEYDFAELQNVLHKIKTETVGKPIRTETVIDTVDGKIEQKIKDVYKMEDADIVRISAVASIDYQTIITVLDATRETTVEGEVQKLFPNQVLGYIAVVGITG
jgi:biopolymer transport protein ExbD